MDKSRVAELKTALASRVDQINEGMAQGVKVEGSNVEVSQETADKIRGLMSEASGLHQPLTRIDSKPRST